MLFTQAYTADLQIIIINTHFNSVFFFFFCSSFYKESLGDEQNIKEYK